jgi:putative transposase
LGIWLSRATVYRMIRLFRTGGTVTSLMDRTRGRREGFRTLDKEREEIIRQTIAGFYLKATKPPFSKLCRQVLVTCEKAGLQKPNWRTIKARVEDVDLQTRGRRRGEGEIIKATTPTPGDYRASRTLEIVHRPLMQKNHAVADKSPRPRFCHASELLLLPFCAAHHIQGTRRLVVVCPPWAFPP